MTTLTAIIKAKAGHETHVRAELLKVADHARNQEPGTTAYELIQLDDPSVFVTWESYVDRAAMEEHNHGPAVSAFIEATREAIDSIDLHVGETV